MSYEFIVPSRIITGNSALAAAGAHIAAMGKKALIVTGKIVVKLDCFAVLTEMLNSRGVDYAVFTGITNEPDDKMISEGLAVYENEGCDFLIGIGGGSPLDAMKAIAVLSVCGGKISDFMGKQINAKLPPMAAIPTTAGTGSEATRFTVVTDSEKGIKMLLSGVSLIPDLAVVDPSLSATSPKSITAATGLDALTHALEAYTSRKRQPLTSTAAMSAAKRIFRSLPIAYADGGNISAREDMSIAALEAGFAINNASVTLVHGMSRPIGALFHVPHGISNAMLLKECLSFALDGAYPLFAELGRGIGAAGADASDISAAEALIEKIDELCKICEVPSLYGYGIDKSEFFAAIDKMAGDAIASGSPSNTIKEVTKQDIICMYERLFDSK